MSIALHIGDCRAVLATLPAASVHCVVTSPPYWGLRDYGCDGQLGLEPDFNAYVAAMVGVFREVRRVLRDDGTLWLNLGDSYQPNHIQQSRPNMGLNGRNARTHENRMASGLKPKDLCGIPWRVAFALQADGWYLRQDIVWSKPNPMPESVTDRCTKAHEYLFLLSKRSTYYYDADAIAEPLQNSSLERGYSAAYMAGPTAKMAISPKEVRAKGNWRTAETAYVPNTRNKRSVWEVTTAPFSEAHFATFPPALIEPCIKAGTSERGCCAQCGKPWVRQIERTASIPQRSGDWKATGEIHRNDIERKGGFYTDGAILLGWQPACACAATVIPCTVLDPFGGAGTTGLVADRLQRNAILIELNPAYAAMSENRIKDDAPLFVEMAT